MKGKKMVDAWINIVGWAVILIMLIVQLGRIECEIEEDRAERMLEHLNEAKGETMARYIDIEPIEMAAKDKGFCTITLSLINEQPTADVVERKRAHWEVVDETEPIRYGCSGCHRLSYDKTNYCSYCGAEMEEEE